ncbi:hypothetical protein IJ118_01845 [Candidatus Saccharibacteria bacterium]|nr:hypothetical protein [Candidatus Saccharibacteria bacterium]
MEKQIQAADYQQLAEFVDALIARKFPENTENHAELREESIAKLSDHINQRIFEQLSEEQIVRLGDIADAHSDDPAAFSKFFMDAGIDLSRTVKDAMIEFGNQFLGGDNE